MEREDQAAFQSDLYAHLRHTRQQSRDISEQAGSLRPTENPHDLITQLRKERDALSQRLDQIDLTIAEQYHIIAQDSFND